MKDALDANVTYAAGPQIHTVTERRREEEEEEEEDGWREEDVDTPDLGGEAILCDTEHTHTHTPEIRFGEFPGR